MEYEDDGELTRHKREHFKLYYEIGKTVFAITFIALGFMMAKEGMNNTVNYSAYGVDGIN